MAPAPASGPGAHGRVLVIGTSAAGKSTFARQLAEVTGWPLVALDPLFWGPHWTPKPKAEFLRLIQAATAGPSWVVDGNYGSVREDLWPRAHLVVWLNYSLLRVFWQGFTRTWRRVLTRQALWHGNRESFRRAFLSRESILLWILTTHARRTRELDALRASATYRLKWVELRNPREARQWLARQGWADAGEPP